MKSKMYVTSMLISNFLLTAQTQSSLSACSPLSHKRRPPLTLSTPLDMLPLFPQIIKRIHRKCKFWWKLRGVRDAFRVCASFCRDVKEWGLYKFRSPFTPPGSWLHKYTTLRVLGRGKAHRERKKREKNTLLNFPNSFCLHKLSLRQDFFWWKFRGFGSWFAVGLSIWMLRDLEITWVQTLKAYFYLQVCKQKIPINLELHFFFTRLALSTNSRNQDEVTDALPI